MRLSRAAPIQKLIISARTRGCELLRTLGDLPGRPLDVTCERAAKAVQQYTVQLIDERAAKGPTKKGGRKTARNKSK